LWIVVVDFWHNFFRFFQPQEIRILLLEKPLLLTLRNFLKVKPFIISGRS